MRERYCFFPLQNQAYKGYRYGTWQFFSLQYWKNSVILIPRFVKIDKLRIFSEFDIRHKQYFLQLLQTGLLCKWTCRFLSGDFRLNSRSCFILLTLPTPLFLSYYLFQPHFFLSNYLLQPHCFILLTLPTPLFLSYYLLQPHCFIILSLPTPLFYLIISSNPTLVSQPTFCCDNAS